MRRSEEDAAPLRLPAREMRIDELLLERDRSEFIRRAIASLPEKQRVAVLLHKYEEMDYGEIAKILECSESALKSLLFRAYETLRVQLAPTGISVGRRNQAREGRPSWKCEDVSKQLIAYLDRRANSAERHEVEEHLVACSACHQRAEISASCGACWTRCRWSSLRSVSMREFAQRIAEEPRRGWLGWLVPQPRLAFAMALLLALSVWMAKLPREGNVAGGEQQSILKRSKIWACWKIMTC